MTRLKLKPNLNSRLEKNTVRYHRLHERLRRLVHG